MELLDSPIRGYAWGSRTAIAVMQARPAPAEHPEAELWMGAHPDSPSTVMRDGDTVGLDDAVTADPIGLLGDDIVARFGPRLPFMLKVLAAATPLSMQAHPDATMAAHRYAQEASLPPGERLYTDPYAKPELLVAIDDFDTLCGFRDPALSADEIASLGVSVLAPVVERLRSGAVNARLRGAVDTLLRWPSSEREDVVAAVVVAAGRRGLDHIAELGKRFPGDMGVVVALLMNHVSLVTDEAIWMPAGNLHAYLRGTGVEVLASSDNVMRGGLTAKRVDVDELTGVLRYDVLADPVVKPVVLGSGVLSWPVPAPEFSLIRATVTPPVPLEFDGVIAGPRIVFCQRGAVVVDDGSPASLVSGQGAFGAAGRPLSVIGDGVVFIATTGMIRPHAA
jgi:mannose-6-phosphate isomerase